MTRHVIITGGSSGIGKALAIQLAQQGYTISLMARTESTLQEACEEIAGHRLNNDQQISYFSLDVSNREQVEKVFEASITRHGTPDLLITSAGIAVPGYFSKVSLDVHEQTMQVNYFGSLYCVNAVLPYMAEAKKGQIVLVSSGAGLVGLYGYTPYSPSKFALRGLAESMRKELKDQGIRVSIVYPPDTDTPQLAAEKKTKPKETGKITESAKMWSAEAVATCILKGMKRNRFTITPGWEMSLLSRLHSLINPMLQCYFDSIVDKVRRIRS